MPLTYHSKRFFRITGLSLFGALLVYQLVVAALTGLADLHAAPAMVYLIEMQDRKLKVAVEDRKAAETSLPDTLLRSDLFRDPSFITPNCYHLLHVTRDNLALVCGTTDVVTTMDPATTATATMDTATTVTAVCRGVSFSLLTQCDLGPSLTTFYHVKTLQDLFLHLELQLERKSAVTWS